MKTRFLLRAAGVALAVAGLSGCASMVAINHQSRADVHTATARTNANLAKIRSVPAAQQDVVVSDLPFVSTQRVAYVAPLPDAFETNATLTVLPPGEPVTALVGYLSKVSGFDVTAGGAVLGTAAPMSASRPTPAGAAPSAHAPVPVIHHPSGAAPAPAVLRSLAYTGSLKGLFNAVANALDCTWRYTAATHSVRFFRYAVKTFHIATIPGSAALDAPFGGNDQVSGGQGQNIHVGNTHGTYTYKGNFNVWASLQKTLPQLLSSAGSFSIDQSAASVTVRDRWNRIAAVSRYISGLNQTLSLQVRVHVAVYRVTRTRGDNRGFNWSILYNDLAKTASHIGASITTALPTSTQGMTSAVLTAPSVDPHGGAEPFGNSKFFLNALSQIGSTSVVTEGSVVTVNNVPAPFRDFTYQGYLAETTPVFGGFGGLGGLSSNEGATLMPGSVQTGFSMSVLPSVEPDGHRLLLMAKLQLSTLDQLQTITSGTNSESIQVPTVSGRQFMPRVWMRSGQTLVLAGFESASADRNISTPFGKHTWFFGGNRDNTTSRTALVFVITPVVTSHDAAL